jgi:AmmeMemoRadiSam system protein B
MTARIRRPGVAGYYYPADAAALSAAVDAAVPAGAARGAALAVVLPHGSYARCGAVLGATLAGLRIPRRCILVGPSHTGSWMPWSLMNSGAYRTPLGDVPIDAPTADALRQRCPFLTVDAWAQRGEHTIEVLVPFLQRLGPADLSIVPIITGSEDPDELAALSAALAQVVRMLEEPVLLIASSDLSHYRTSRQGRTEDGALIARTCALDGAGLFELIRRDGITMCGAAAVAAVLEAARQLGAQQGELTAYATSGDAGGDPASIIGYGGIRIV